MNKNTLSKSIKLQSFLINLSVFAGLIVVGFMYILPKVSEVKAGIEDLKLKISEQEKTDKIGLSFNEFKSKGLENIGNDEYTKKFLETLEEEFFNRHYISSGNESYEIFLANKEKSIDQKMKSNDFAEQKSIVSKVLPSYGVSQGFLNDTETPLSDYDFVNYLENILKRFDLVFSDQIGIENIELIQEENELNNGQKVLKNTLSLYKIPVRLKLEGKKGDMMSFVHYLENVGRINADTGNIIIHKDDILQNYFNSGENFKPQDIYNSQFLTIEKISFEKYIDNSSANSNKEKNNSQEKFFNYLTKTGQKNEHISLELDLNFYASGINNIKFLADVDDFVKKVDEQKSKFVEEVNSLKGNTEPSTAAKLNSLNSKILILNKMLDDLEKLKKDGDNLKIDEGYSLLGQIKRKLEVITKK